MALQARTEFAAALNQIASEKGVDVSVVVTAIEQAALAAYRKDLSLRGEVIPEDFEELVAKINPSSGEISILRGTDNITPPGFARIAAQTAKQVIAQKLHEAEKGAILDEYDKKVGTVISGTIQRQEGSTYYVDLGRAEGVLPMPEQVRDEVYLPNQRMKFYIKEIRETGRGPEVVLSRSDAGLIKGLFAAEVPEIQAGSVEIKVIAREAGGRTKLAAISSQEGVDPVGSLVGQKGVRVQTVINEIGEEKVDIISYSEDPATFIASALAPAKDIQVSLDTENMVAKVKLPTSQLSLAIGKGGQNVRLAAKLTGWKIDIEGLEEAGVVIEPEEAVEKAEDVEVSEAVETKDGTEEQEAPAAEVEATEEKEEVVEDKPEEESAVVEVVTVEEPKIEENSETSETVEADK
jgi:N utilization substance protein A